MGTDAGAHLADEMPCPSINAPKVMVYPIIIGLVTGSVPRNTSRRTCPSVWG